MHENEVPIMPMVYFGTCPVPLCDLHLTEEQMRILKGMGAPKESFAPAALPGSSFPEDEWLLPDEEEEI